MSNQLLSASTPLYRLRFLLPGLLWLATVGSALAQPTLRIGANTRVVGTGAARLTYGGGTLTNNGLLSLADGPLTLNGPTTYGGSGTTTVVNLGFYGNTGGSILNSLVSVTGLAVLNANTVLNANGQLYLRTDLFPNAAMVNDGVLSGTVQGLVTRATVTSGATPYSSQLSVNMSGAVMRYQWQSSANNSTWTDVAGATGPTYTASVNATVYYRCRLTTTNSPYDQTTPARLLTYIGTPAGQTVCRGGRLVLEAGQTGSSYQWYRNGTTAANKLTDVAGVQQGTRTASLTLVSVQTTATYYCVVTNGTTNQTTGPFVVTVNFGCTARQGSDEPLAALTVLLAPNPLEDNRLRATVRGAEGQPLLAELTDLRGYVLRRQQWTEAPPELTLDWEVSQGTPLLLLRVSTGGQQQTIKVFNP